MSYPKDFVWGVASAAFQIEGGASEDGKGASIWDTFSHTPGKTFDGHNGDTACDAYHRYEEDLNLMVALGIRHYRFSISWPRVIPDGGRKINPAGLAYYDRVVDGCLLRGIEPWITLYHWDLPQSLQDKGGWLRRETAEDFAYYASVIAEHFKGRVTHFMPLNEPQCTVGLGHGSCVHAPGIPLSQHDRFLSWHHLMLAHGMACQKLRQFIPDAQIGIASTGDLTYMDMDEEKRAAATPKDLYAGTFLTQEGADDSWLPFNHQWVLDPLCMGHYPDDPHAPWAAFVNEIDPADMEVICQPLDFIGLNIYNGHEMIPDETGSSLVFAKKYPGYPRTALKWPVTPGVLYWGPRMIYEHYKLPVIITENGLSCNDFIYLDGKVHDADRIDFLHRYLLALRTAAEDGVNVAGYLHWALTDNFEWHSGYEERFGLIYIDYRNQQRIPKDSAYWFAEVIRKNGENL